MGVEFYAVYKASYDTRLFLDEPSSVSAMCSFGNLLFVGCVDGQLLQIVFDEIEERGTCYSFNVIFSRQISKNPVSLLRASQSADLVVALSGAKLQFFDAEKLECSSLRQTLDNISTFSLVDYSMGAEHHSVLAVCNLSLTLQVYRATKSRIDLVNTINIPATAIAMQCRDSFAVFATDHKYYSVSLKTRKCTDILDRCDSRDKPLIETVSEEEFLLSGPGSLGIFVNANGQSDRPPLTLSANLSGLFSRQQLVFAVDDEFVSIHCANQQKQLQTLVVKDVSAACMSLNRKMVFVASNSTTEGPCLCIIRPETWDLVARRLIMAGCLSDASDLIDREYAKLIDLCNRRPATSSNAKNIFNTRSKRVYTLMGFYLFETGHLDSCREFFEKSSLDVRELLYRFVDLLPRGYAFTADPNLRIESSAKASFDTPVDEPPRTIFDLSETLFLPVQDFRRFLLNFLIENRYGRIFATHLQFVETAIVKLCVHLFEPCSPVGIGAFENWEQLVGSLSNIDVNDLLDFLEENRAYHVKALVCRWNGDMESALNIWKSLALGTVTDAAFPGPEFYTDALYAALVAPFAFRGHTASFTQPAVASKCSHSTGSSTFARLVWAHLDCLLDAGGNGVKVAAALIQGLAGITTWTDDCPATLAAGNSSTFVFAPATVLKRLLPEHPALAENFLWCRIFKAGDKDQAHHVLLAELQARLLLQFAEADDPKALAQQRHRFRETLLYLKDCPTEKLLETLKTSPHFHRFTDEYVTLLGKLQKYTEALELLVLEKRNVKAALNFCAWCAMSQARQRVAEQSVLWLHGGDGAESRVRNPPAVDAYTTLIRILLDRLSHGSRLYRL
uniref:CNH domain-containing protein n=1 Tax=Mesocestoides corti TaxID=53468 RepID=A0A5K3EMQ6_MESCO